MHYRLKNKVGEKFNFVEFLLWCKMCFFREEMHTTRGMWKAMVAEGYKEKIKMLTRAQVRTIVQFLGEP